MDLTVPIECVICFRVLFLMHFMLANFRLRLMAANMGILLKNRLSTVVVKRQAEEVGKRAPDKLRAQGNYKHKTRARLKERARK